MIFADTSFWVALRNQRDVHHAQAARLLHQHASASIIVTNDVRGETWTYLRRRCGHRCAVDFLEAVQHSPRVRVFSVTEDMGEEALRWLRRHDEREYSFVDATSFVVMRTLRISEALSFDGDFSAAGFTELRD